jgi:hypothetical protein
VCSSDLSIDGGDDKTLDTKISLKLVEKLKEQSIDAFFSENPERQSEMDGKNNYNNIIDTYLSTSNAFVFLSTNQEYLNHSENVIKEITFYLDAINNETKNSDSFFRFNTFAQINAKKIKELKKEYINQINAINNTLIDWTNEESQNQSIDKIVESIVNFSNKSNDDKKSEYTQEQTDAKHLISLKMVFLSKLNIYTKTPDLNIYRLLNNDGINSAIQAIKDIIEKSKYFTPDQLKNLPTPVDVSTLKNDLSALEVALTIPEKIKIIVSGLTTKSCVIKGIKKISIKINPNKAESALSKFDFTSLKTQVRDLKYSEKNEQFTVVLNKRNFTFVAQTNFLLIFRKYTVSVQV